MPFFKVFLSVIIVTQNQSQHISDILTRLSETVSSIVADYEIIVVDNASDDNTLAQLKALTQPEGLPNLQIFALANRSDDNTASWVGMENALGDYILMLDPTQDDITLLPQLLTAVTMQADVVFAYNQQKPQQTWAYRIFYSLFKYFYRWLSKIDLSKETPTYRIMSRRLVSFMLQHPYSLTTYRQFPAESGFAKTTITYNTPVKGYTVRKSLKDGIERGMRLLISTSHVPMRLVTLFSVFGALANLVYSFYVIAVMIWKSHIAPGWVTLSLQQSGMFFLISLVLLILSEYILHIVRSPERPLYHIAQEYTSAVMKHRQKLNVE